MQGLGNTVKVACPVVRARAGVHVSFTVHAFYPEGFKLVNAAIDGFFLAPARKPRK